ncbi:MAG TPA: hypothetical protein VEG33_10290, partial [Streptosporangiaceae bacterium]|nr:hypothetical protein [Streptosporangiaceae bacterium]
MADADDQGPPESPRQRPAGAGGQDGLRAAGDEDHGSPAAAEAGPGGEPGPLLTDLARLRRQARVARHAYWFPLVLFGVLTCGAAPLYVAAAAPPPASGAYGAGSGPTLLGGTPGGAGGFYIGWYWTVALVGGYLLTLLWYRRHAGRAGVWTPARGYLITGVVLTVLAVAIPPLTRLLPGLSLLWLPLGDVWIRGTLAFLIIAIGLWVLARAERSRVLAVIALVYTGAALLSSLYNVENIVFRLGWNPRGSLAWQLTALPNVLLPAAILLVAGCATFLVQRTRK